MMHLPSDQGSCVALGNFDGIHLGHRAIVENCVKAAREMGLVSLVWTFRRHPEHIMKDAFHAGNIVSLSDKTRILTEMGIDHVLSEDFERVRDLSPEAFCKRILLDGLCAKKVFCGFNFRFGKGGAGDARFLKEFLAPFGVETVIEDPVCRGGAPISSTRIRALLAEGEVDEARALLGRPYFIRFPVLHGKRLGRRIGFPTINQAFPAEYVIPRKGVYAVRMEHNGSFWNGICNVGNRPTVESADNVLAETHLFDFDSDLYGKKVKVEFFRFLRPEIKFATLDELTRQIEKDRESALSWWKEQT